ncbi:hypothetical protein MATL_G00187550 [Megalops atlanticus]|uniref:Uncharacterized protein n=1 Tax=Megalops atlanticus TaxID=7932 RepID=A0A9D3PPQ9_MEGAT|nr:hypothetical protein MATL_G00187550 [Megalops atlanticus]
MASLLVPHPGGDAPPAHKIDRCLSVALPPDTDDEEEETLKRASIKGDPVSSTPPVPVGPQQPCTDSGTGGPHDPKSGPETPHRNHPATEGVKNGKNAPATSAEAAAIDPRPGWKGAGVSSDAHTDRENALPGSRSPAGEESTLEEASAAAAALPLTTPTMPEMIECEGDKERVAEAAAAETGERAEESTKRSSSPAARLEETQIITDRHSSPSLILEETARSPAKEEEADGAGLEASEGETLPGCCVRMPHNSEESEGKGGGGMQSHSPGTDARSLAGEREGERAPIHQDDQSDISPPPGLPERDCQEDRAGGKEREREGEGGREVGNRDSLERADEQISLRHTAEPACGGAASEPATRTTARQPEQLARDERVTRPPHEVSESTSESQCEDELTVSTDSATGSSSLQPFSELSTCGSDPLQLLLTQTNSEHRTTGTEEKPEGEELVLLGKGHNAEQERFVAAAPQTLQTAAIEAPPGGVDTKRDSGDLKKDSVVLNSSSLTPSQPPVGVRRPSGDSHSQQVLPSCDPQAQGELRGPGKTSAKTTATQPGDFPVSMKDSVGRSGGEERVEATAEESASKSTGDASPAVPGSCASLPPLTVHESLRHPVMESSSTLQEFSSLQRQETPPHPSPGPTAPSGSRPELEEPAKPMPQSSEEVGRVTNGEEGGEAAGSRDAELSHGKELSDEVTFTGSEKQTASDTLGPMRDRGRSDTSSLPPAAECQGADPAEAGPEEGQRAKVKVTEGAQEEAKVVGGDLKGGSVSVSMQEGPKSTKEDSERLKDDNSLHERTAQHDVPVDILSEPEKPLCSLPSASSALSPDKMESPAEPQTIPPSSSPPALPTQAPRPEENKMAETGTSAPEPRGLHPALSTGVKGDPQPHSVIMPPGPLLIPWETTTDSDLPSATEREPSSTPASKGVTQVNSLSPDTWTQTPASEMVAHDANDSLSNEEKGCNELLSVSSQSVSDRRQDDVSQFPISTVNGDMGACRVSAPEETPGSERHQTDSGLPMPSQSTSFCSDSGTDVATGEIQDKKEAVTLNVIGEPPKETPLDTKTDATSPQPSSTAPFPAAPSLRAESLNVQPDRKAEPVTVGPEHRAELPTTQLLCTHTEGKQSEAEEKQAGMAKKQGETEEKLTEMEQKQGDICTAERQKQEEAHAQEEKGVAITPSDTRLVPAGLGSLDEVAGQNGGLSQGEHLFLDQDLSSAASTVTHSASLTQESSTALSQSDLAPPQKIEPQQQRQQQELGLSYATEGLSCEERVSCEGARSDGVGADAVFSDAPVSRPSGETQGVLSSQGSAMQPGNVSEQRGDDGGTGREGGRQSEGRQQADITALRGDSDVTEHEPVPESGTDIRLKGKYDMTSTDKVTSGSYAEAERAEEQSTTSEPLTPTSGSDSSGQRSEGKGQEGETLTPACEDKQVKAELRCNIAASVTMTPAKCDVLSLVSEDKSQEGLCATETGSTSLSQTAEAPCYDPANPSSFVGGLDQSLQVVAGCAIQHGAQERLEPQTDVEHTPAPSLTTPQLVEQSAQKGPALGEFPATDSPSPPHLGTGRAAEHVESSPPPAGTEGKSVGEALREEAMAGSRDSALSPSPAGRDTNAMQGARAELSEPEGPVTGQEFDNDRGAGAPAQINDCAPQIDGVTLELKQVRAGTCVTPPSETSAADHLAVSLGASSGDQVNSDLNSTQSTLDRVGQPGGKMSDGAQVEVAQDSETTPSRSVAEVTAPVKELTSARELSGLPQAGDSQSEPITESAGSVVQILRDSVSLSAGSQIQPTSVGTATDRHSQSQQIAGSTDSDGSSQTHAVSESTDPDGDSQAQHVSGDTNWLIQALRDAASLSQTEEQHRAHNIEQAIDHSRPIQTLPSPQADLEFRTPTEEVAPAVGQSDEQPENRSSLIGQAEEGDRTPVSPAPPEDHDPQPSLPAHLLRDGAEFPTPPPTPPERCPPTPPASAPPELQTPVPAPSAPDPQPDSPVLQPKGPADTLLAPSQNVPHR